jgi:transposase
VAAGRSDPGVTQTGHRRARLVRQRTRIKNQIHAILTPNLAQPRRCRFGKAGRYWLSTQPLPADERSSVHAAPAAGLPQRRARGGEELAVEALCDPVVARLMTIPDVDAIAGISIAAAVGDIHRFDDPDRLVAYVG